MRDRNWRRGQRDRAYERAIRKNKWLWEEHFWGSDEERHVAARKAARTRKPCSRYCCGNPRRHWDGDSRLTMQEHRANQDFQDQLDRLND